MIELLCKIYRTAVCTSNLNASGNATPPHAPIPATPAVNKCFFFFLKEKLTCNNQYAAGMYDILAVTIAVYPRTVVG